MLKHSTNIKKFMFSSFTQRNEMLVEKIYTLIKEKAKHVLDIVEAGDIKASSPHIKR